MLCRINNQTLDISGVRVDKDDLDTGADDQDASEASDDTMPLTHTPWPHRCWPGRQGSSDDREHGACALQQDSGEDL